MYYTGKGDGGTTTLFGCSDRVSKQDPVFAALGSVDELNSWFGLCGVKALSDSETEIKSFVAETIISLQEDLFVMQAQLAGAPKEITPDNILRIETIINSLAEKIKPRTSFIIPGGSELSAMLDVARTMARRTERFVLAINPPDGIKGYLNRLSSICYVLARYVNDIKEIEEHGPSYN